MWRGVRQRVSVYRSHARRHRQTAEKRCRSETARPRSEVLGRDSPRPRLRESALPTVHHCRSPERHGKKSEMTGSGCMKTSSSHHRAISVEHGPLLVSNGQSASKEADPDLERVFCGRQRSGLGQGNFISARETCKNNGGGSVGRLCRDSLEHRRRAQLPPRQLSYRPRARNARLLLLTRVGSRRHPWHYSISGCSGHVIRCNAARHAVQF